METMKAEIEKILDKVWGWASCGLEQPERDYKKDEFINQATSSLTTLIIKWLEGKRVEVEHDEEGELCGCKYLEDDYPCETKNGSRNQLITELIGEVR
jgi:hypothetical protein